MTHQRDQHAFLAQLWALDDLLVSRGFPAMSEWWHETITDFYLAGRRQAVVRKGRRVGASTIVGVRIAVCEALHGQHRFSPGDRGTFAFLSVKRSEAAKRVKNIAAILDVLRIRYSASGELIELDDYPIDFAVKTASHRTEVGDLCIGVWCDEVSRWLDSTTGANPATEVLAAIRPTIATLPNARMWLVSSPLGNHDAHAKAFDAGDNDLQLVFFGETWTINPTLTEDQCRALEPDERLFQREYGAIPSDSAITDFFGGENIRAAMEHAVETERVDGITYQIATDAAFISDRFGVAVASQRRGAYDRENKSRGPSIIQVHLATAWKPEAPTFMAKRLRNDVCARWGTMRVHIDQHESSSFSAIMRDNGLHPIVIPWTAGDGEGSKLDRFKAVRLAMLEGSIRLPLDPDLRSEMGRVQLQITAAGNERIVIPRSSQHAHGDRTSALVMAASVALAKKRKLTREDLWMPRFRSERSDLGKLGDRR